MCAAEIRKKSMDELINWNQDLIIKQAVKARVGAGRLVQSLAPTVLQWPPKKAGSSGP